MHLWNGYKYLNAWKCFNKIWAQNDFYPWFGAYRRFLFTRLGFLSVPRGRSFHPLQPNAIAYAHPRTSIHRQFNCFQNDSRPPSVDRSRIKVTQWCLRHPNPIAKAFVHFELIFINTRFNSLTRLLIIWMPFVVWCFRYIYLKRLFHSVATRSWPATRPRDNSLRENNSTASRKWNWLTVFLGLLAASSTQADDCFCFCAKGKRDAGITLPSTKWMPEPSSYVSFRGDICIVCHNCWLCAAAEG